MSDVGRERDASGMEERGLLLDNDVEVVRHLLDELLLQLDVEVRDREAIAEAERRRTASSGRVETDA